jgi:hypothetical protein
LSTTHASRKMLSSGYREDEVFNLLPTDYLVGV